MAKKKNVEKTPRQMTRRQLSHHKRQQRRQRIIFIGGIAIIVAVVLIVLLGWFLGEFRPMHQVVIRVGDVSFNTRYFIDTLKIYGQGQSADQFGVLSTNAVNSIIQNEIIRQAADRIGIRVSDEEAAEQMGNPDVQVSKASLDIVRVQLVQTRVKDEFIGSLIPVSDNQVNIMAMFVESHSVASELRERLMTGDNFTALAAEFAQNYTSKQNNGEYGWHPRSILDQQLGSQIPIDFAFSAAPGTLSEPLDDAEQYKQLGYWLIRVQSITEEEEAMVQALYLSSRVEALDIRARLEAGDNLTALADEYSQYSPSQEGHGDLGLVAKPAEADKTAITEAFDGYVFGSDVKIGEWSEPIQEDGLWTKGGAWLVEVIDREADRKLSDEDRNSLIDQAYDDWENNLMVGLMASEVDNSGLTPELNQWAIDRAIEEMQSG